MNVGIVEMNEKKNDKYSKKQIETDFVYKKNRKRYYIQSTYVLPTQSKTNQELRPLLNVNVFFKKLYR